MAATPETVGPVTKGNCWSLKRMRDLFPASVHTAVPRKWQRDTFSPHRQYHRPHSSQEGRHASVSANASALSLSLLHPLQWYLTLPSLRVPPADAHPSAPLSPSPSPGGVTASVGRGGSVYLPAFPSLRSPSAGPSRRHRGTLSRQDPPRGRGSPAACGGAGQRQVPAGAAPQPQGGAPPLAPRVPPSRLQRVPPQRVPFPRSWCRFRLAAVASRWQRYEANFPYKIKFKKKLKRGGAKKTGKRSLKRWD